MYSFLSEWNLKNSICEVCRLVTIVHTSDWGTAENAAIIPRSH
jgi:hypothetical protein